MHEFPTLRFTITSWSLLCPEKDVCGREGAQAPTKNYKNSGEKTEPSEFIWSWNFPSFSSPQPWLVLSPQANGFSVESDQIGSLPGNVESNLRPGTPPTLFTKCITRSSRKKYAMCKLVRNAFQYCPGHFHLHRYFLNSVITLFPWAIVAHRKSFFKLDFEAEK